MLFVIILQLFHTFIHAQPSEQIYTFNFSTKTNWTIGGAGVGISTNCPDGGTCWYMGKGIAWGHRTYSVLGYHTIRVFIDIRNWDLEPDEYCNVRYQTGTSGGWQTLYNFIGNNAEQIRRDIELFLPSNVDNRADFEIEMYSSHIDDFDWCQYDNLEIWGIPYAPTSAPTITPTVTGQTWAPSLSPTTYPSEPSDNPTKSPTDYEFCLDNDDNINAGFITLNNKW
eukprot:239100_1